jgi:hypothetical protein
MRFYVISSIYLLRQILPSHCQALNFLDYLCSFFSTFLLVSYLLVSGMEYEGNQLAYYTGAYRLF